MRLVLMLDFDGTLSKLAPTPGQARMLPGIKSELKKASRVFTVAVVSGRPLSEIKRKVGLRGLIYAGNHGWEWDLGKGHKSFPLSALAAKELVKIKKELVKIAEGYCGAFVEDKKFCLAFHYRRLNPSLSRLAAREAKTVLNKLPKNSCLEILMGSKTIELRPKGGPDKGKFVKFLLAKLGGQKRVLPVYIGDDATDEDVFRSLKHGLTIKVGRSVRSRAKYYLKNNLEVKKFIQELISFAK